jgi:hypothetical protein
MKLKALALVVAIAGFAALTGCETMSAEECAVADWRALGYQDAAARGSSRFADRAESCAERGIQADNAAYGAGMEAGMYQFCRPENGFAFARGGNSFSGACPSELAQDFSIAFQDGQRVRASEQALQNALNEVSRLERERDRVNNMLRDHQRGLYEDTAQEDIDRHRREIDRFQRERRDINDDLRRAQLQLPSLQRDVDDLRYEIGNRWGGW